jgi:ferredoxin-fold anticodon binding domain-containing protein
MSRATDVRKAEMRLSGSVMLKLDDPRRHDKFSVRVLSDEELMEWKTRIIDDVQTEITSLLKHWGVTDESQLTTEKIQHLDGMKEQISDITLLLSARASRPSRGASA